MYKCLMIMSRYSSTFGDSQPWFWLLSLHFLKGSTASHKKFYPKKIWKGSSPLWPDRPWTGGAFALGTHPGITHQKWFFFNFVVCPILSVYPATHSVEKCKHNTKIVTAFKQTYNFWSTEPELSSVTRYYFIKCR